MTSPEPAPELAAEVAARRVLICAGAGGVGKTSVAAMLALHAAHHGRRAVVLTIDPARRLADALGLDGLSNEPHRIAGPWPGELHALMLDTKSTFDDLVARHASSPAQTKKILRNRFYRNISHALSGTQEYMAAEKLYELHVDERFDLVVLDTPPTRQALDFLDAPGQLTRFLDHRVYRLMTASGRGVTAMLNRAGFAVLRTASRLVGASVMEDAIAFFTAFEGMEAGFRDRAQQVRRLLTSADTGFVVVTSPQADTVREAAYFLGRLEAERLDLAAIVANRVTPRFAAPEVVLAARRLAGDSEGSSIAALADNLVALHELADGEDELLRELAGPPPVRIAQLDHDVHDLAGLEQLRQALFGR